MTDAKRPTWAELQTQAPGLCEAVLGWLERKGYPHSVAADLLEGKTDTDPFYHLHDDCLPDIRLRAAEYRMEAEAAARACERALLSPRAVFVVAANEAQARMLADALDAAADEAEARAGGAT